jgi:mycothiol synthase
MDMARTHDSAEAAELLATGGRLRRLADDLVVDLDRARRPLRHAMPSGLNLGAFDHDAVSLAHAASAATGPDHVDFQIWWGVDRARYWRQLLDGEGPCGPVLHEPSRLVRETDGAIAAAVLVSEMLPTAWWAGGPWIPEIFVVAKFQGRGVGGLLLEHALGACARAGDTRLGLTVSQGNPARRLYERFGFRPFRSTWFIERP